MGEEALKTKCKKIPMEIYSKPATNIKLDSFLLFRNIVVSFDSDREKTNLIHVYFTNSVIEIEKNERNR